MSDAIEVVTTTPTKELAEKIAASLVEKRLAACAQVASAPIRSVYRWKGKVESAEEWLCIAKTRRELFPAVEAAIRAMHPYEVPQIVALPIVAGGADYLAWILEETGRPGEP